MKRSLVVFSLWLIPALSGCSANAKDAIVPASMDGGKPPGTDSGTVADTGPVADTSPPGAGTGGRDGGTGGAGGNGGVGGGAGGSGGTTTADGGQTDAVFSCGASSEVVVAGQKTGFAWCDGVLHRPAKVACPQGLPRAQPAHNPGPNVLENCRSDAECTAKANGYCDYKPGLSRSFWDCTYGCLNDQDCGAGAVCVCGDPVGTCVATTACTIDGDCGLGKRCAQTGSDQSAAGACQPRFACESTADQCRSSADCLPVREYCALTSSGRKCMPRPQDAPCF